MLKNSYNGVMLREDKKVRQVNGEPPRRWFSDDYFDLIVWNDEVGDVFAFQLCYDRLGDEHALVWHAERGYSHYRVDQGEIGSLRKATPMMMADGLVDMDKLRIRFVDASTQLEPDMIQVLLSRFDEWQPNA